jgi:glycine oxidase
MPRARISKTDVVTADVVIIGGGVMGCSCAWLLANAGLSVVVLEKSVPGAEASSAAAGILGARAEAHGPGPMADLLLASARLYPEWSRALAEATHIDIEYRQSGVLRTADSDVAFRRLNRETRWMRDQPDAPELLNANEVRRREPALAGTAGGVFFSEDARVDPKLLFRAVHVAARNAGVRFETGATVRRLVVERGRARGVVVDGGKRFDAPCVVLAAGSWSTDVVGAPLAVGSVIPARGQMVELEMPAPPLAHVVFGPRCYLVPRDDGRVLVGATVEFVGYLREVTARAVRDLLDAALTLAPVLEGATLRGSWSSFRPYTKDELPLLGKSAVSGLVLATGHYRNGILLAPITAEIIRAIVLGKKPPLDIRPFEASRLGRTEPGT